MMEAAFFFSIMSAFVKFAGKTMPVEILIIARTIMALVLSYALISRQKISPWGNNKKLLVLRGLLGTGGLTLLYYAITKMPLGDVTVIQYTNPVFVAIGAAIFLKEKLDPKVFLAAIVSFFGVVLIAKPSFLFPNDQLQNVQSNVAWIAFAGALFAAAAYVTVRKLGESEEPIVIVFWFPLISLPILLPFAIATGFIPSLWELFILLVIGVLAQIAQVRMTQGLKMERAAKAISITYLQVAFAFLWGLIFFGEVPSLTTMIGALAIIFMIIWISKNKTNNPKLK